jgi:hypothetical protein
MKKKYAAYALILTLVILPTIQCGILMRAAPLLLQGGYAMAVKGEATIVTEKGMRIRLTKDLKLTADNIVFPGSRILTGANSSIDLAFTDSIKVRLGGNSSITLDASRILESEHFSQIKMKLTSGKIFADAGKLAKNSSFIISTLQSVVHVRGTEFAVEETGSSNSVLVQDGSVAITDLSGSDPKYVKEGEAAAVGGDGKVNVNPLTGTEKQILKEMSSDIASLKAADKERIRAIVETNKQNIALIKEAYEVQKALMGKAVSEQKDRNAASLQEQKSVNAKNTEAVKSSVTSDIEKIKNKAKEMKK